MSINTNKAAEEGLGAEGFEYITGTGTSGPWVAVQCIGTTTFTTFTSKNQVGDIAGVSFSDQYTIRAPITAIVVASGAVIATRGTVKAA